MEEPGLAFSAPGSREVRLFDCGDGSQSQGISGKLKDAYCRSNWVRRIGRGGRFDPKYQITVPAEPMQESEEAS